MLFNPAHEDHLERLNERLRLASAATFDLFSDVMANCARIEPLAKTGKTGRLARFIQAKAWTDAALTLIALETPDWKLRRLEYQDGEWVCSLSTEPNMPVAIDDTVDARHEVSALAILGALLETRRKGHEIREIRSPTGPQLRPATEHAMCCDDFA
jgi:hypothetical protein